MQIERHPAVSTPTRAGCSTSGRKKPKLGLWRLDHNGQARLVIEWGVAAAVVVVLRRLYVLRDVLNAFRHHRGGHCAESVVAIADQQVLNAFRHHRGGHSDTATAACRPVECSTPFGITEVGT